MSEQTFTPEQIYNWTSYEMVRKGGETNMFDLRRGAALANLSRDEYMFCLRNYSALREAAQLKRRAK